MAFSVRSRQLRYVKQFYHLSLYQLVIKISERIQQEVSELRSDLATLDANLQDFKRSTINKIEQIDSSIADIGSVSKASTMICFRCHGYVVEYIQLQCGHLFCLHCEWILKLNSIIINLVLFRG